MAREEKLMLRAIEILQEKGKKALELARHEILQEEVEFKPLREALHFFMGDWQDFLHPALLSIACEAVGGQPELTTEVGAAIVLLAGGADIHDDIIDESTIKGTQLTVYGKFGKDIAILAGDTLLFKGMQLLHIACEKFPKNKRQKILGAVKQAFFEISSAEAEEASYRGRMDLSEQKYLDIIKRKVAAGEASMKIGAIIGNGTIDQIELLGHYGRTYGILMAIRDEFVDIFEVDEFKNRAKKECLPLPILVTFKNSSKKGVILQLLRGAITEDTIEKVLDLTLDSEETTNLKRRMEQMVREESQRISLLENLADILALLLKSTLEDLQVDT
ncbi:MAG: polyprenyl synthetase family protein [Candidatus Bathyarchaeota archaeon]|nr:polyprenyl synthetase family protein [Candidatus Bathyarchaeota archaeon]